MTTRRDGNRICCRLASARVAGLWSALREVAAAHPSLQPDEIFEPADALRRGVGDVRRCQVGA